MILIGIQAIWINLVTLHLITNNIDVMNYLKNVFVLFMLFFPLLQMNGNENTKVINYPADKFGYPSHQFPAEVVVSKDEPRLFFSKTTSFGSTSSGLDKGDTIRVTDWGLSEDAEVVYRVDVVGSEKWIFASHTKFVKVIEEKELSNWSYVSWEKRGMIALIIGLMVLFIHFINRGWILRGIIAFMAFIGAELFYVNCMDLPTWFVEPVVVGWVWTVINAILLLFFTIFHVRCADKFLSLFLYTDMVSLWGLRISIILTIAWGRFGYLILAASLLVTLVINLFKGGWRNILYTIVGVIAMYFIHKYSVEIYEPFSTVFTWIFALAIFSAIPSSDRPATAIKRVAHGQSGILFRTGSGRPHTIELDDKTQILVYHELENGRIQDQNGDLWDVIGNVVYKV